ncbi:MAG: hypothetical protein WCA20_18275 [Candidatus Sulfotelmatobacter sp.]
MAPCCHTINDKGEVAGFAIDGTTGNVRAIVWLNRTPIDLNTLIPKDSPWYLLQALSLNDAGQIVGFGTIDGNIHAFLATPCDADQTDTERGENVEGTSMEADKVKEGSSVVLPGNASEILQNPLRFGSQAVRPQ